MPRLMLAMRRSAFSQPSSTLLSPQRTVTVPAIPLSEGEAFCFSSFKGEPERVFSYIILGYRLPSALTAALAGAGLATSGLLLQTAFHNPLAGPSILGISSGANLGVAIVMLAFGGSITAGLYTWNGYLAVVGAAFLGSLLIMGLLLLFSSLLKNNLMLLITGIGTDKFFQIFEYCFRKVSIFGFKLRITGNLFEFPYLQ